MPGPELSIERGDDHVAVVEIHRPPNNLFDVDLLLQLAEACEGLAAEADCRAIVLASEGRNFCAGANFADPEKLNLDAGLHLYDVAIRLFEQPLPIVAAVQGAAIGGGLGLALAADLRVATPESRFAANFARLGFHQGFGISVTLPAAVGAQAATELLYTGRRIEGDEALRLGLCDRLVPAEVLRREARALAAEVAASAPLAVRSIRRTLRGPLVARVRSAMAHERAEQDRLMSTEDWREGMAAAGERRLPAFVGR